MAGKDRATAPSGAATDASQSQARRTMVPSVSPAITWA